MKNITSKKIVMLMSVIGVYAVSLGADVQPMVKAQGVQAIDNDKVQQLLSALNSFLGVNGVTTNPQLRPIVDMVEKARGLLLAGGQHLQEALDLISKAQNMPGSKTILNSGLVDPYGHHAQLSVWRMLALVSNGKDPLATEKR